MTLLKIPDKKIRLKAIIRSYKGYITDFDTTYILKKNKEFHKEKCFKEYLKRNFIHLFSWRTTEEGYYYWKNIDESYFNSEL